VAPKTEVDKPERSPTVILFAETRGFTGMSDMLDPGVVLARVAEFVKLITKAIEEYEGAVVNILSDTVMATFTGQDDAQHAVAAAQEIQSGFAALATILATTRYASPDCNACGDRSLVRSSWANSPFSR